MRTRLLLSLLLAAPLGAHAQDAPPIKPGLWQVKNDMRMPDGSPMPDMRAHLQKLPPDMRRQMEARMKQQGVDLSGGLGDMKVCLSKQSLEQNNWQGQQGNCKTEVLSRSASTWKWRSVCTDPQAVIDGEALFASPEAYTMKTVMKRTAGGQTQTARMTTESKWLGSDCGDLKPMAPRR